ncbi:prepilin-type N-terminal cleavage/methylation domain-containing protein [Candidatus Omnitrophota bacterium]
MHKSFTLIELVIVVIIIGVLATLGLTQFGGARENALDKEAIATLRLLQAAQRVFGMESGGQYYDSGGYNIQAINQNLRLSIPAGVNRSWDYAVQSVPAPVADGCAEAVRLLPPPNNRTWRIRITEDDPQPGTC